MNKNIIGAAIFVAGAAVGSVTTWYLVKKKYEQFADEQIESVKAAFSHKPEKDSKACTDEEPEEEPRQKRHGRYPWNADVEKREYANYVSEVSKTGYTNDDLEADLDQKYDDIILANREREKEEAAMDDDQPYVISPEDYSESDEYEKITLFYYADDVLTDDQTQLLDDPDNTVGTDFASHFGEYEADSVFVRNDRLRCDFEILLDEDTYANIIMKKPYLR